MISVNEKEQVWAEKYRPQTIDDLIFPESIKEKFREWLNDGSIPNIGIFGSIPGTGKSSLLNVLITQLKTDTQWINGSKENGIDTIRQKIGNFADTMSISGNHKLICIDEADYLTINAQATLRSDIELYSEKTRFAFTGNEPERMIEPLLSRLQIFDLDRIYSENKKELSVQIYKRLVEILENEKVQYEQKQLLDVIKAYYPSSRNMLMHLEQNTVNGVLKDGTINRSDEIFKELVSVMKTRKFKDIRSVVSDILVPDSVYTYLFKNLDEIFEIQSQPNVIMAIADMQDYSSRAKNKHIPLMKLMVLIIGDENVKFK
jgi:replication factor C small subunit